MKNKYLNKEEYYVDDLWFQHGGTIFRGNGVLTWSPEKGFHLVAKILKGNRPRKVEIRSIEIVKPPDYLTQWQREVAE